MECSTIIQTWRDGDATNWGFNDMSCFAVFLLTLIADIDFSANEPGAVRDRMNPELNPGFVRTDIMKNQGASEKEAKLFYKICADLDKTVKKIMRRLKRGKSRIIVGLDARMMNLLFKLFPKRAPRIITWFLRKTKLEIFKEI